MIKAYTFKVAKNDTGKAGAPAGKKLLFGDCSRYAIAPVHTRFEDVWWFVWDADVVDEVTGNPAAIRIEESFERAVAGLNLEPYDKAPMDKD